MSTDYLLISKSPLIRQLAMSAYYLFIYVYLLSVYLCLLIIYLFLRLLIIYLFLCLLIIYLFLCLLLIYRLIIDLILYLLIIYLSMSTDYLFNYVFTDHYIYMSGDYLFPVCLLYHVFFFFSISPLIIHLYLSTDLSVYWSFMSPLIIYFSISIDLFIFSLNIRSIYWVSISLNLDWVSCFSVADSRGLRHQTRRPREQSGRHRTGGAGRAAKGEAPNPDAAE